MEPNHRLRSTPPTGNHQTAQQYLASPSTGKSLKHKVHDESAGQSSKRMRLDHSHHESSATINDVLAATRSQKLTAILQCDRELKSKSTVEKIDELSELIKELAGKFLTLDAEQSKLAAEQLRLAAGQSRLASDQSRLAAEQARLDTQL